MNIPLALSQLGTEFAVLSPRVAEKGNSDLSTFSFYYIGVRVITASRDLSIIIGLILVPHRDTSPGLDLCVH